jgi:hypothetical protein
MGKSLSAADAILAGARNKAQAARARSQSDSTAEKPRDVILGACEAIAAALEGDGFAFLRSGPKLKRADGDLTFQIFFQSDRNNMAGRRAAVWIHAGVRSATLGHWRRAHPMPWGGGDGPDAGLVAGGQIGNLTTGPNWLEWDFADRSGRAAEIDDAIATIRRIVLPFFALFANPARAVETLIHRPVLRQCSLLEYAVAVLGREAAEAAGRAFLAGDSQLRERFEGASAAFREHGLPRFIGSQWSDLAALAVAADLDLSPRGEGRA